MSDGKDETQALSIRLPKDLYERLRRAAFEQREPMNAIITRGVERELASGDEPGA
jgi:predicted DNA-binding protein